MPLGQNSSLKIGQIIYVLSNKAQKIIPAIVIEEMTVKKLDGNEVSWKVSVGPTGKEKIIDSKRLDGELYASLDEVQGILKERLEQFINTIVEDAAKRADVWYRTKSKIAEQSEDEGKIDPDSLVEEEITSATPKITEAKKKPQLAKEARNKLIAAMSDEIKQQNQPGDIIYQEEIQLPERTVKVNIRT